MRKPRGIFRPLGLALVLAIGFGAVFGLPSAGAFRSGKDCTYERAPTSF